MTDVVAFLIARLAEDEQIARDAGFSQQSKTRQQEWIAQATEWPGGEHPFLDGVKVTDRMGIATFVANGGARAEHVARHDPARVLAEVAAKRAILAEHKHAPATEPSTDDFGCQICAYDRGDCVLYGWGWCNTVRLLAAPYADHPDYDPAWRVE